MTQSAAVIVGDWRQPEFAAAVAKLEAETRCQRFDQSAAAVSCLERDFPTQDPSFVVLFQARPGQITESEVERLHAAAPLSRLAAVVGPWCDGEARSGRPWPGVVRIPWHAAASRLSSEIHSAAKGGNDLPLVRTVTASERIEADILECVIKKRAFGGWAAVRTGNRTTFDSIGDALAILGIEATWHFNREQPLESAWVVVCDGFDNCPAAAIGALPVVLLLAFPRPADLARAQELGIQTVIATPLLLGDFAVAIAKAYAEVDDCGRPQLH